MSGSGHRRGLQQAPDSQLDPRLPPSARPLPEPPRRRVRRPQPRIAVYVRLQAELFQRLDAYCTEHDITKQDAVEYAIEQLLAQYQP